MRLKLSSRKPISSLRCDGTSTASSMVLLRMVFANSTMGRLMTRDMTAENSIEAATARMATNMPLTSVPSSELRIALSGIASIILSLPPLTER